MTFDRSRKIHSECVNVVVTSPNIVWPNESDSILNAFRMLVALTFGHSLFLICSNECFDHKSYFNIKPNNNAFKLVGFSFRPKPRREVRIYHSMWYAVQSRAPCYCVCVCARCIVRSNISLIELNALTDQKMIREHDVAGRDRLGLSFVCI